MPTTSEVDTVSDDSLVAVEEPEEPELEEDEDGAPGDEPIDWRSPAAADDEDTAIEDEITVEDDEPIAAASEG